MVDENEQIEIDLLLQAIYLKYGYDFRNYARATVKRRILRRLSLSGLGSISEMQHRILNETPFFDRLLRDLSINVTEMYRDPLFFRALKQHVLPNLMKHSHIKIWCAGCATGEEVYSVAITLMEENIYEKSIIYATDFNEEVLRKAKEGIYQLDLIKRSEENYNESGGRLSFGDYYSEKYGYATMKGFLKKNIVFADHNLATDSSFGEIHLVLCRNVLIYFNRELQDRAIWLFSESLSDNGFLCLGTKETVKFSSHQDRFKEVDMKTRIYQKV